MIKRIKKLIISNYKWIIFFVSLILFLGFTERVFTSEILKCDVIGYNFIKTYLIHDSFTNVVKIITFLADPLFLILLTIILFICIKNRRISFTIGLNLALITLLNQILKIIFGRPRPTGLNIINVSGYSFPSGHSMISMAFYGYLIYLIYKTVKNKHLKISLITINSILIILIGISRIYLGVHYTSDILAGFLLSISYLIIYIKFVKKLVLDNKKIKDRKIIKSFKYAFEGISCAFQSERNMKIHIFVMLLISIFGIFFKLSTLEWIICIICFALVIGGELFNTAIEITVDLITTEINDKAKKIKDISAGAVLVFAIGSMIVGLIIFVPKIVSFFMNN